MQPIAPALRVKPKLRGVSHKFASFVALVAGALLVAKAPTDKAMLAAAVYSLSLLVLFSASALYHVPTWTPVARQRMRRVDHASIFVLIAGTYTPICLLALPGSEGHNLLAAVWAAAAAGILQSLFWVHAPKPLSAALYLLMGWMVLPYAPMMSAGGVSLTLLFVGGAFYTVGAVIYALKRPDPLPTVFGYHEIFHAMVVVASICHFTAVGSLVLSAAPLPLLSDLT